MNKMMQVLAVCLVSGMFAAAGALQETALVFPEIAALAIGAWVMQKPPWHFTALSVWLSPTLAAFTGVFLLRLFPGQPLLLICAAFVAVTLQLRAARSAVIPSLSAAILPIVTKVDTILYPLSVCVLTGIIAVVHLARARVGKSEVRHLPEPKEHPRFLELKAEARRLGKLTSGVFLIALFAIKARLLFMVAPPLIVTFVELTKPESPLRRRAGQVVALLALAAFTSVIELHLLHYVLNWPVMVSAAFTLGTVFILYHFFALPFPPASAIALLPTIIPVELLWVYPWHVLLGSAAFVALSLTLFRRDERT